MALDPAIPNERMPMRDWFGLGVRLIGLWEIVSGIDELVAYGNVMLRLYTPSLTAANAFLTHAIARLVIGFFLLYSAMAIVNSVYGSPKGVDENLPEETT